MTEHVFDIAVALWNGKLFHDARNIKIFPLYMTGITWTKIGLDGKAWKMEQERW